MVFPKTLRASIAYQNTPFYIIDFAGLDRPQMVFGDWIPTKSWGTKHKNQQKNPEMAQNDWKSGQGLENTNKWITSQSFEFGSLFG